jgi:hypothetical protein
MSTPLGLIVPIDVLAYCLSQLDSTDAAPGFMGGTTDYTAQTTGYPAYLGTNVTRGLLDSPLWQMEAGVHIHWAMPDGLTRAANSSPSASFPPLPNRWLVTRVVGNTAGAKHWIVESDTVSTTNPGTHTPPTVATLDPASESGGSSQRSFRFLGVTAVFDSSWVEPNPSSSQTLKTLAGANLHTVSSGDIAFAAFYPNARSIFGLYDDLSDLQGAKAELMYTVVGWYSDPSIDPVNAGFTVKDAEKKLGWTFKAAKDTSVNYSLYNGLVQSVQWDPDPTKRYVTQNEPITGDVAIGNTPSEALAAYFRGKTNPTLPTVEELLTLYFSGLASTLVEPTAGRLAALEETLHGLQFSGVDGGTIYSLRRGDSDALDLPLPLADAVTLLNELQQAADLAAAQTQQGLWMLFASWYRLFTASASMLSSVMNAFPTQLTLQGALSTQQTATTGAAATQKAIVEGMLAGTDITLTAVPNQRYYTPTEPVVLLAGDAAAPALRYGGDGRHHEAGYLVCRVETDVLQSVTVGSATLNASQYALLTPTTPNNLPYAAINALIEESALLDTAVAAAVTGVAEATLAADLLMWLGGNGQPAYYQKPVGLPPSLIGVNSWSGANPWYSMMMAWQANFHPLLATSDAGSLVDYPSSFFTSNYRLDPNQPRSITYSPSNGGIFVDPATLSFDPTDPQSGTQAYTGISILSTTAADNLLERLVDDPDAGSDPTLKQITTLLENTDIAMQGLTGFNDELLSQERSLQLAIACADDVEPAFLKYLTSQTQDLIPSLNLIPSLAPQLLGEYNGVRAGYLELKLTVIDPFGRTRPVQVQNLYIADTLATYYNGKLEPGIVFTQPRLAQPTRLLFRWLAADTLEYDEMNDHPATTPVCGWLLPNHLVKGFFIYETAGNPLGSLTLRADESGIEWQSAPGSLVAPNTSVSDVMKNCNPHLRDLVLALSDETRPDLVAWFKAFWQTADSATAKIAPSVPSSQSGLAVLVGRPLALVQASLLLQRQGLAALDQTAAIISANGVLCTDHAVGGVQFPVVIGDLQQLDDGLVGYFKLVPSSSQYDMGTFYSEAAPGNSARVVIPSPTNVWLTPTATDPSNLNAPLPETKLLMLIDPRASVHATMGILPAQTLSIPPDQYADTLAGLEMTVQTTPLLRPASGLVIPLPTVAGYNWTWVTETLAGNVAEWQVDADVSKASSGAVWQYSPQSLDEGWMRLNPELLRFALSTGGSSVVTPGQTYTLTLSITNTRSVPVTFKLPVPPDGSNPAVPGSILYMHFGSLVSATDVPSIQPSATGWSFQPQNDTQYGSYWSATPTGTPQTLAPGATITISLANVKIASNTKTQAQVYFDYHNLTGCDDGVDVTLMTLQQQNAGVGPVYLERA